MKYSIKDCPLCGKRLQILYTGQYQRYYCPTLDEHTKVQHYFLERKTNDNSFEQHYIVYPFKIETKLNDQKSKVYDLSKDNMFIVEYPIINPENPEKLLKRLKNLIIYS